MAAKSKKTSYCQLPTPGNIAGRTSTITNAFFNAIIPIHVPSEPDVEEALRILGIDRKNITCVYCGNKSTEWDHLNPIIRDKKPTGYITEIANLVPACGKCNQSKGKSCWRDWMVGDAKLSPKKLGVKDIEGRISTLTKYEELLKPKKFNFDEDVVEELRREHEENLAAILDRLRTSQEVAKKIRKILEAKMAVEVAAIQEGLAAADNGDLHDHDEVMTMMDDIIAHG